MLNIATKERRFCINSKVLCIGIESARHVCCIIYDLVAVGLITCFLTSVWFVMKHTEDITCRVAVNMNLLAVQRMVKLCKGFKKLEVFVHVSSAFANCERPFIEEIIYPSPVEPQKLIDAME